MPLTARTDDETIPKWEFLKYMSLVRAHLDYIVQIKAAIKNDDVMFGSQLWWELEEIEPGVHSWFFRAPTTRGGIFTPKERDVIRTFKR